MTAALSSKLAVDKTPLLLLLLLGVLEMWVWCVSVCCCGAKRLGILLGGRLVLGALLGAAAVPAAVGALLSTLSLLQLSASALKTLSCCCCCWL
jgi:hypothetical protein